MAGTLAKLIRLRRFETDTARRALGAAIAVESAAAMRAQAARDALVNEARAAQEAALAASWASWLPLGGAAARQEAVVAAEAGVTTARRRDELAQSRALLRAAQNAAARAAHAERLVTSRRVQMSLDEMGGSRR